MPFKKGYVPWNKGIPEPEEKKQRQSERMKGNQYAKGYKYTEEQLERASNSHKGINTWVLGTLSIEEKKKKLSLNHANVSGNNNPNFGKLGKDSPNWNGGRKMSWAKTDALRRELGNINLNLPNIGLEGHHINMDCIVYVPKKINRFCYHNVRTGKNMGIINYLSLLWLIISSEINNIKEI